MQRFEVKWKSTGATKQLHCTEWHPVFVMVVPLHCAVLSSCLSTELSGWFLVNVEFNFPKLQNLSCDFLNDQTWFLWMLGTMFTYLLTLSLSLRNWVRVLIWLYCFTCSHGILSSFTCVPFLLFIKQVMVGVIRCNLVLEKSDRMVDHASIS